MVCDCFRYRTLTYAGGFLGIFQSIFVLSMSWYFCELYCTDYIPRILDFPVWAIVTRAVTIEIDQTMKGLLITTAFFNALWLLSCIAMMVGHWLNRVIGVTQWVVMTTIITVLDIIFLIYFCAQTRSILNNIFNWNVGEPKGFDREDLISGYILLLFTVGKGGFLMWLVNMFFSFVGYKRAVELLNDFKMDEISNNNTVLGNKAVHIGLEAVNRAKFPDKRPSIY